MPPHLALLLCFIWCGYVYHREAQSKPDVSSALWLPSLWIMRCASRSIDAWFSGDSDDTFGRLDPIVLLVLMLGALMALARRNINWSVVFSNNLLLLLFYAYMSASVFWSVDPGSTAYKLIRPWSDLILALVVITERNPTIAIITIMRRCTILLIPLSIVLIKYFPHLGKGLDKHWGDDPWIGVSTHKNPLGQLCMLSGLTMVWCHLEAKRLGKTLFKLPYLKVPIDWVYAGMILWLLNAGGTSRSSTSIVCLVLAIGLLWLIHYFRNRTSKLRGYFFAGVAALGLFSIASQMVFNTSLIDLVSDVSGKDRTLTGREWLWSDAIRLGKEHPVGGYGYGAFWGPWVYDNLSPEVDNRPRQCHNGYLETFVNLGLVGVVLLCLVAFASLWRSFDVCRRDFEYGRLQIILLITILILNYSEASFPRGTHVLWFMFLVPAAFYRISRDVVVLETQPLEYGDGHSVPVRKSVAIS